MSTQKETIENSIMKVDDKKLRLLLKDCASGFYQQMYFLGKDVIHPLGNQLEEYGFQKSPSKGLKGTSCYSCALPTGLIELYGSCAGLYSKDESVVFLRKKERFYQWLPEHKLIAGRWSLQDLKTSRSSSMLKSLTPLLNWWLNYEKWIEQRFGKSYREQCFTEWRKVNSQKLWLPPSTAIEWVQQLLELKDQQIRPKHFAQLFQS